MIKNIYESYSEDEIMSVDVVIPTYKPGAEFKYLLGGLALQSVLPEHIIIVNTRTDEFNNENFYSYLDKCLDELKNSEKISLDAEKLRKLKEIIEFHEILPEEFNHGLTRNMGREYSRADYVIFMTQDAVPADSKLVINMLKPFEDKDVNVVYARQLPRKECKYVEKYVRSFNYPDHDVVKTKESIEELGIKAIFCSDVCAAYRRENHEKMGGFKKTNFNEDMIFAYDTIMANAKVYYSSNALVVHSHNYSYMQQLKRNIEIGKSQTEFSYIFDNFKSENEGIKMIKNGIIYLIKKGKFYYIPDLILSSGFKYIGFKIGKKKK